MKNIIVTILCFGSICMPCLAGTDYRPKNESDLDEDMIANKVIVDLNFNKYLNNNGTLGRKYTQFGFYTVRDIIRRNQGYSNKNNDTMTIELNKDFVKLAPENKPSIFFDKVDFKNRYYRGQWTLFAENSVIKLKSEAKIFSSNHFVAEVMSHKIPLNENKDLLIEGKCAYLLKNSVVKAELNTDYQNIRMAIENHNYLADDKVENIYSVKYMAEF